MAKVGWSGYAIAELEAIQDYIRNSSPLAAQRVGSRLIAAAQTLSASPMRGRLISRGRRELTTVPPYLIRYRLTSSGDVLVVDVRHGAREPD